jgi:23S rRNA maturation-related 3'-5' exoribonuclease YhaM
LAIPNCLRSFATARPLRDVTTAYLGGLLEHTLEVAQIAKAIARALRLNEDLVERKELLNTRSTVLARQEERLRSQVKEAQSK